MAGMTQERRKIEIINAIQQYYKEIQKVQNDILNKAYDELEYLLEKNKKYTFSQFYKSYTPKLYKRTGDLKEAIEIEIDKKNNEWTVLYTSQNFTVHTFNGEYILEIVFKQGWHGGDDGSGRDYVEDDSTHPSPGVPWWHKIDRDENSKKFWIRPAVRSEAPIDIMNEEIKKSVDYINNKYSKIYEKKEQALINRLLKKKLDAYISHMNKD